jgi:hypothetical protein
MTADTCPPDPDGREPAPAEAVEGPAPLGGHPRAIRFPPFWHEWFARQTQARLAVLDEMVDARIERRVLHDVLRRVKHAVVVAFIASAAAAHWFSDQVAWLAERLPVLKFAWHCLVGGR